jgi:hypothetical protein
MALKDKLKEALNDEVEVDFSGASDGNFDPIEPADYELCVDSATVGTSKAGAPKVVVVFKIVEGEPHAGRTFFRHCPATGTGAGILRDTAKALGIEITGKKFSVSELVGKRAIGTIAFQKGSDEYQEIKKLKALPTSGAAKRTTARKGSSLR